MSYNEIEIGDTLIKGHKGLGFGGVQPSISSANTDVDVTAPFDGICEIHIRGVSIWYEVKINGKHCFSLGGDDNNVWHTICFPVVKDAVIRADKTSGTTVYETGIKFIGY